MTEVGSRGEDLLVDDADPREAEHRRLAAELAEIVAGGFVLPGSLVDRWTRCGKPTCRCHGDPPRLHGPYPQWSHKRDGQSVTRLLDPEQVERYRPWLEAGKRLHELLREMEALGVAVAESVEGWGPPGGGRRRALNPSNDKPARRRR